MTRSARLAILFDVAIVLCYAFFLWAPWDRTGNAGPTTLAWLALPVTLAHHGFTLQSATVTVTISALAAAALGAFFAIVARLRGLPALWATGAWLFGCAVSILMPAWTAVGFLGALLLLAALRSRFAPLPRASLVAAILSELWPIGYAAGFAALAWRYNPQLLLKCLLISFGVSLVARALVPSQGTASA